jgi:hypothetical protein
MDEQNDEEATDPRWQQPQIDDAGNEIAPSEEAQPLTNDEDTDSVEQESQNKTEKLREAQVVYKMLSRVKKRSPEQESKYKSAAQIIAKNG